MTLTVPKITISPSSVTYVPEQNVRLQPSAGLSIAAVGGVNKLTIDATNLSVGSFTATIETFDAKSTTKPTLLQEKITIVVWECIGSATLPTLEVEKGKTVTEFVKSSSINPQM